MTPELIFKWANIVAVFASIIVYWLLYRYQSRINRTIKGHLDDIDKAFEVYKKMVSVEDMQKATLYKEGLIKDEARNEAFAIAYQKIEELQNRHIQVTKDELEKISKRNSSIIVDLSHALSVFMVVSIRDTEIAKINVDKILKESPDSIRSIVKDMIDKIAQQVQDKSNDKS